MPYNYDEDVYKLFMQGFHRRLICRWCYNSVQLAADTGGD